MARLLSVNVGRPRDIVWKGRTVHTGIWKDPVPGRSRVDRLNVEGDGQGDLAGHGGEQRAVFVYQLESYRYWQERLQRTDFVYGQFGENFTIEGLPDDEVCVGDRFRIGSARFEVTQPRVTCYRVGIRMNEPRMPALLTSSGRPGFYLRVLQPGDVGAGDDIVKEAVANERMTIAEINALLYSPNHPRDRLELALRIDALSAGWRSSFESLLQGHSAASGSGNAGLMPAAAAHPVASGFRALTVTAVDRESTDVLSLTLRSPDAQPLPSGLPGQYVVVRLQPTARGRPLFRSYSLSGPPSTEGYRISVKIEPNGAAGAYVQEHVRVGDVMDVSRPRGNFILQSGERPVVLLSAGIGATPVLAMLHALAAAQLDATGVVAARSGRRAASSICRGSPAPHAGASAGPQLCVFQQAASGGHHDQGLRRGRAPVASGVRRGRPAIRRGCLPLWADAFHGRHEAGARHLGCDARPHTRRALQRQRVDDSRCHRQRAARAASPQKRRRHRSRGVLRPERHSRALERVVLSEHPGVGRSMRRSRPVVVPERCVSQL